MDNTKKYFHAIDTIKMISDILDDIALSSTKEENALSDHQSNEKLLYELKIDLDLCFEKLKNLTKEIAYVSEKSIQEFLEKGKKQYFRKEEEKYCKEDLLIPMSKASLLSLEYSVKIIYLKQKKEKLFNVSPKNQASGVFISELRKCILVLFYLQKKKIIIKKNLFQFSCIDFLKIPTDELSKQMVLIETDLFCQFDIISIFLCSEEERFCFLKKFKNYLLYSERWIFYQIMENVSIPVIEKIVELIFFLTEHGGFNTAKAIFNILCSKPFNSLNILSELSLKSVCIYKNLNAIFSEKENFNVLRNVMKKQKILLPPIDIYLKIFNSLSEEQLKSDLLDELKIFSIIGFIETNIPIQHWLLSRIEFDPELFEEMCKEKEKEYIEPEMEIKEEVKEEVKEEIVFEPTKKIVSFPKRLYNLRREHACYEERNCLKEK